MLQLHDIKIDQRVKNTVTDEYATIKSVQGDKAITGFTVQYDGHHDLYNYYPLHERDWFVPVTVVGSAHPVHHMMLDAGDDGMPAAPAPKSPLPHDSAERKTYPIMGGVLDYFPSAIAALAHHSYLGNEKHNPGEPLHWARGKSDDHLDAAARHLMERDLLGLAWRALAALQLKLESEGHPQAPGAKYVTA